MQKEIGHAKDYIEMQWLMLQQDSPEDFVIATGRMETVRKFIEICAEKLNWNNGENKSAIIWEGQGVEEIGRRADTNQIVIRIDKRFFRPAEVEQLLGDPSKAYKKLNWEPKITLEELISEMINNDLKEASKEVCLKKEGLKFLWIKRFHLQQINFKLIN